jgi:GTP pyrophosphokinase
LLTLSEDFRVILIKIADRLHNMRTLESMAPDKQKKIASETVYIYAPMAHRLGLYNIKSELEDLSLKYNNPEVYNEITEKLELAKESRERYIEEFKKKFLKDLKKKVLNFTIKGRAKAISSIYRKMLKQGFPLKRFLTTMPSELFINRMPKTKNSLPGRSIPSLRMFITVILQECVTGSPSPVLQDMKVCT